MQAAFRDCHALQCGFCTPGMIMQAVDIAQQSSNLDAQAIRQGLEGNLCRCTGYQNIVEAVAEGASMMVATNTLAREA
jgi:carbon-monoxide dehydrogenase small subunit